MRGRTPFAAMEAHLSMTKPRVHLSPQPVPRKV
jgi:hypothetical protein